MPVGLALATGGAEMSETAYTLACYRVRPGHEQDFLAAWRELAKAFASLPEPPR
jgi:hypothetical protein